MPRRHAALLVLLTSLVFANTLRNELHLDDHPRIADNPEIERFWPPWRHFVDPRTSSILPQVVQYRPLLPLTLSVDHTLASAVGVDRLVLFHVTNIALHTIAVLLLYALFSRLAAPHIALAAAALYAVHPVAGVPVNYVCARDLLLMQLFLLAALLAHARAAPHRRAAPLALAFAALSILSKTDAAVLPALVLAHDLTAGGAHPRTPRPWLRAAPYAALVAAFFLYTELVLDFSDADQLLVPRPFLEYPLTQLSLHVRHYLRNALWPLSLHPLPDVPPVTTITDPWTTAGALLVTTTLFAAWHLRRSAPTISLALFAYWMTFAPTSSLLPLRRLAVDYRQVPALPWLCLLAAAAISRLPRRIAPVLAAGLVALLAAASIAHNQHWRTEESLWRHSVALGGEAMAHHNYAFAIQDRDPTLAEHHYRETLRRDPDHTYAHVNLGLLLQRQGRGNEGLALLRAAAERTASDWAITHHWYARALAIAGRPTEAARESARASDLDPRDPRFAYQAAWDACKVNDFSNCLTYTSRLHALQPEHKESRFLEGFAHQKLGHLDAAIMAYQRHLATHPTDAQVHFNLGHALMETRRCAGAVPELLRTLDLKPTYRETHQHLAHCYDELGRPEDAARHRALYGASP
jgi:Flp pilus assembly protein TadD